MSRTIVVDESDKVIGIKLRDDILPTDLYRVSALWMTNSNGQVLMAQRSFTKKVNPGVWGPAVAGTIEEGEDYDTNIIKEIEEEIGLKLSLKQLTKGPKIKIKGARNYFVQWYLYQADINVRDLTVSRDEVADIAWYDADEILRTLRESPEKLTPAARQWLPQLLEI